MDRLKAKVASSSSRVIASLQQAAAGASQRAGNEQVAPAGLQEPAAGASKLMGTNATAHLTEEERRILLQVFKKEEQFERDTIKQMRARQPSLDRCQAQQQPAEAQQAGLAPAGPPQPAGRAAPAPGSVGAPNQSSSLSTSSSAASNSFASARSGTPLGSSRPGSSLFSSPNNLQQQLRNASLSSGQTASAAAAAVGSPTAGTPAGHATPTRAPEALGKCRICRKCITSNEACHLCSNCNQFICEDCASYSTSDQHWMCSVCRRRTTKPAIPAEALKELGLNQNSSPVRRMTLRLNQNELKMALSKGSSESSASSNSSSGCSSMSSQQQQSARSSLAFGPARAAAERQRASQVEPAPAGPAKQPLQLLAARTNLAGSARAAAAGCEPANGKQVSTVSQTCDMKAPSQEEEEELDRRRASACFDRTAKGSAGGKLGSACEPAAARSALARAPEPQSDGQRRPQHSARPSQHQSPLPGQNRRASVAVGASLAQESPLAAQQAASGQPLARKQSLAGFQSLYSSKQHQQPLTIVTASSEASMGGFPEARRDSLLAGGHGAGLIPVPADQMHLRRLSDQSNLFRRSSIIADNCEALAVARNRSHSNIDTVIYSSYLYQSPLLMQLQQQEQRAPGGQVSRFNQQHQSHGYSDDNLHRSNRLDVAGFAVQQRRPSDQWELQQHAAAQRRQSQQPEMASLITSYSQKQPQGSEELHSDSSSDIDDEGRLAVAGFELEGEQPSGYFAAPRALSAAHEYLAQQQMGPLELAIAQQQQMLGMPSIPSVSVSEFSGPYHLQRVQQQQQQPLDQIMTTPMQINSAIEQAILKQQQQQSNFLSSGVAPSGWQVPRRGSSGRVLPKIPGEQSRSLLDLPRDSAGNLLTNQNVAGSQTSNQQLSMLDLPSVSPTIRRASAPEGQNIKIVVDDIDGAMKNCSALKGMPNMSLYGKQGEFLERLTLYRDDSLDPNTNMARGFGLQVMGGKIDEEEHSNKRFPSLQACVSWVLPGGPADKVGLRPGDRIVEWDGKCLVNMTYEQVAEVIESSANIAELLVRPAQKLNTEPTGANYVRSQRRMSQQTEHDLKRFQQQLQEPILGQQLLAGQAQTAELAGQHVQQLLLQRHQKVEPALSAGSLQSSRAGTGRRLPQIPGAGPEPQNMLNLGDSKPASISTGQLIEQQHYAATQSLANHLAGHEAQHGRSAGDLYLNYNAPFQPASYAWPAQEQFTADRGYQQPLNQSGSRQCASPDNEICGSIGLQVNVDERVSQLEICVLSAINMYRDLNRKYYVRVRILPDSNLFKPCTTLPRTDMNWNETLLFQNFPIQQIQKMALEIGIWVHDETARLSTQIAQPLCETLISIQRARERNTDFWPLRKPVSSPQSRRKSLNDLLDSEQATGVALLSATGQLSAGYQPILQNGFPASSGQSNSLQPGHYAADKSAGYQREKSSSNRNLPETNKVLKAQPRRASDEVAGSNGYRLAARMSPGQSRLSVSVLNLGRDGSSRSSSRRGSQMNVSQQARRDSSSQLQRPATGNNPLNSKPVSPTPSNMPQRGPEQSVGVTPSGRRSSLAGIQSMAGYRSQKNSQSDTATTDQDSPLKALAGGQKKSQPSTPRHTNLLLGSTTVKQAQHRASVASASSTPPHHLSGDAPGSGNSSRRGSTCTENSQPQTLQRKGSFAVMTLRKIKRTMSLTKGNDQDASSRRSSGDSSNSMEMGEDEGVTKRIMAHTDFVGKLKLSFIMTMGSLEVDVISAQGLKYEQSTALAIYVKMYLKGKNRTNKRKTRLVQPTESPTFKQMIKYDGSLVDNKSLEVSVWQKQGGLKGKVPIGFTEIRLSELNLSRLQASWYNLRSMDALGGSSIDD